MESNVYELLAYFQNQERFLNRNYIQILFIKICRFPLSILEEPLFKIFQVINIS